MTPSPYLTAAEAIAYLRLSHRNKLYWLIEHQRLPFCRRGKKYLFDTRELDAWLRGYPSALDRSRRSA